MTFLPALVRTLGQIVLHEERNVLAALAERRQVDRDDVEAVVEIFAEPAGRDGFLRSRFVAATRRTSTRRGPLEPTRSNSPSCSTRRSFTCISTGMPPDLVEEERAAVGELEAADRARTAPVKAPRS